MLPLVLWNTRTLEAANGWVRPYATMDQRRAAPVESCHKDNGVFFPRGFHIGMTLSLAPGSLRNGVGINEVRIGSRRRLDSRIKRTQEAADWS